MTDAEWLREVAEQWRHKDGAEQFVYGIERAAAALEAAASKLEDTQKYWHDEKRRYDAVDAAFRQVCTERDLLQSRLDHLQKDAALGDAATKMWRENCEMAEADRVETLARLDSVRKIVDRIKEQGWIDESEYSGWSFVDDLTEATAVERRDPYLPLGQHAQGCAAYRDQPCDCPLNRV